MNGKARQWTAVAWGSALTLAVGGALVLAFRSHGYAISNVTLNDGGVWVTRNVPPPSGTAPVARFIAPIKQFDAELTPPSGAETTYRVDVYQSGADVALYDEERGVLWPISPVAGVADRSTQLAIPGGYVVSLGGASAAVLDPKNGKLWAAPFADFSGLNPAGHPTGTAGGHAALAIGADGTVYAISGTKDRLLVLPAGATKPKLTPLPAGFSSTSPQLSAVGSTPVALDPATGTLMIGSKVVRLPLQGQSASSLLLQQPSESGSAVLVAGNRLLYSVPLNGDAPKILSTVGGGAPAAPVELDNFRAYAAWGGGKTQYLVQSCGGTTTATRLRGAQAQPGDLEFRVNYDQIALNNTRTGAVFGIDGQREDDWQALQPKLKNKAAHHRYKSAPQHRTSVDRPPVARPDHLGARLGQSTILHVLDNDFDPDGDVLAIDGLTQPAGQPAQVAIVQNEQAIKISFTGTPTGDIHFGYTIDDGRGKKDSTTVTVHIYPPGENAAPNLLSTAPHAVVPIAGGQTITLGVLTDWRDRDGDALFLASAKAASGIVSVSNGNLSYTATPTPGHVPVTYVVSDGRAKTAHTVIFDVLGQEAKAVPATTEPDVYEARAGQALTFDPLANDLPGADPTNPSAQLQLGGNIQGAVTGLAAQTNTSTGNVTVTGTRPGSYLLTYTAEFGSARLAVGHIRVDVSGANGTSPPITLPVTAVLHGTSPVVLDPTVNDIDPQNDLLVVQSASASPGDPLSVTVLQHHWLRIAATSDQLSTQPMVVHYLVTDGVTQPVVGDVTVDPQPALDTAIPPTAANDTAVVRAGGSTAVSVLANDTDPEGEALTLVPGKLKVYAADNSKQIGSAWAVDGVVRYVAPPAAFVRTTRQVTLEYTVENTDQAEADGLVTVTINPASSAHDQPPVPLPLSVRIDAGQSTTIRIPVDNVDPDGDVVTFSGITRPPTRGRILSFGPDSVVYQAYPTQSGPDEFTYQVTDPYGRTGTATVTVGIGQLTPLAGPVAVDDQISAAPGAVVRVPVLANDVIAPGDQVTLGLGGGQARTGARIVGSDIVVKAPAASAPPLRIRYTVGDGSGPASVATLAVQGVAKFDNPPVAVDDYVTQPPAGHRTVVVDVLANDYDPDTASSDLKVIALAKGSRVLPDRKLSILLGPDPRLVPYEVSDGTKTGTATAFVHVPGLVAVGPVLRTNAPAIVIPAGGSKRINLAAYISDSRGPVHLTTTDKISGSPVSGLAVTTGGPTTLVVRATGGYQGPGAVSFEVTDGKTLNDPHGRRAILTLPVRVGPLKPYLQCPSTPVSLTIGAAATGLNLGTDCLVWLDNPSEVQQLSFHTSWKSGSGGIVLTQEGGGGRRIALTAPPSTRPGSATLVVTTSGVGQPASAFIPVRAVPAPAATAKTIGLTGLTIGKTVTVETAPYLSSPFGSSATPKIVTASGTPGVAVSASGTTLSITPHKAGSFTLQYTITDVATEPGRAVTGTVTIVVGSPQTVTTAGGHGPTQVTTTSAPAHSSTPTQTSGATTTTTATSHAATTTTAAAKPATTTTAPPPTVATTTTPAPPPVQPPAAPQAPFAQSPGNAQEVLQWAPAVSVGAPVIGYQIEDQNNRITPCPASPCTISSLTNGNQYTFRLRAENKAGWSAWSPASAPITPNAVPGVVPAVSATPSDGQIAVSWTAPVDVGTPVTSYVVQISPAAPDGSSTVTVSGAAGAAPATSYTWSGLTNGTPYSFAVQAMNAAGSSPSFSAQSSPEIPFGLPPAMPAPSVQAADDASSIHNKDVTVGWSPDDSNGSDITGYTIYATGSTQGALPPITVSASQTSDSLTVTNDGQSWTYRITATNAAGESSSSPASVPFIAHTYPDAMTAPSASVSNSTGSGKANLSFTIPSVNGAPVTMVKWTSSGGGSGVFSFSGAATGAPESEQISGLTNGQSYTFTVQACNSVACGGASPSSNAVTPYTTPATPTASANVCCSNQQVTLGWSGGGGGGLAVTYWVSINGGTYQNEGSNGGQTNAGNGYNQNESISVYVKDTAGQQSGTATAQATTPAPPETVDLEIGSAGTASIGSCTSSGDGCHWLSITLSNFPGKETVTCYDSDGAFWSYQQSNGTVSSGECIHGSGSYPIYVVVDGVSSQQYNSWP